jgi:hypothetical protein
VPYFADEQEVYQHLGRLFQDVVADAELAPQLQRLDTTVQFRHRAPDSTITLKLLGEQDPRVDLGATDLEPEVVLSMAADTAHRLWLGKANLTIALARGQIRVKGPVAKLLKLVPLVKPLCPRYYAQLEAEGRRDLAAAE